MLSKKGLKGSVCEGRGGGGARLALELPASITKGAGRAGEAKEKLDGAECPLGRGNWSSGKEIFSEESAAVSVAIRDALRLFTG
jgi:hypothetical protein